MHYCDSTLVSFSQKVKLIFVTISFLSHVFFLISVIRRPYFSFAPSYQETDRYLLTFPSYSSPLVLPLQYRLVLQDCLTP